MDNIIEKHINKTQKRFRKYLSLILKSKYNRTISDELIQTYIEARYYNYGVDEDIKFFYRRIYDALVRKANKLVSKQPDKKQIIENTVVFFQYFFYFDNVRTNMDVNDVIQLIAEKRITRVKTKLMENQEFIVELTKLVKEDMKETDELLEAYDSDEFDIEFRRVDQKVNNYFYTDLLYFFDFPELFSKEAINEVFNTDIIAEDKLFVEYPMITNIALKDILVGSFNRVYVVDFAASLLKKKKKMEQLITVMENQAAQDKIYFEVKYDDFNNNKEEVYNLMKRGFKFALLMDENMKPLAADELKILDVFSCIISNPNDVNIRKYNRKSKILIAS